MMFEGEDCNVIQTLLDNNTFTSEDQPIPIQVLNAIQTVIKEDKHFCHYGDKIKCDLQQLPDKGMHAFNNHITTLINNSKFTHPHTKETLKLMLLWHVVKYYEAHDLICIQDQQQLTYQSLLAHCKLLKSYCEQFQKAQERAVFS